MVGNKATGNSRFFFFFSSLALSASRPVRIRQFSKRTSRNGEEEEEKKNIVDECRVQKKTIHGYSAAVEEERPSSSGHQWAFGQEMLYI